MLRALLFKWRAFIRTKPITFGCSNVASLDNLADRMVLEPAMDHSSV